MKKAIFVSVLSLLFIATPFVTSAQSVDDLRAQINSLLAMVAQLQAQLQTQTGSSNNSFCYTFNRDLQVGDRGMEVSYLHTALEKQGFSIPDGERPQKDGETVNDTRFGEPTASKVSEFQEKYKSEILTPAGLSYPSGYVGARTRAKLNQLYGCSYHQLPQLKPITVEISSNPSEINAGESTTISWKSTNATFCGISYSPNIPPDPSSLYQLNGSRQFTPPQTTTYTLICDDSVNQSKVASVEVNVYPKTPQPTACTMDAMMCPDGSYVGRTGPSCQFATCPKTTQAISTQSPKINISYPFYGTNWEAGKTYTISWSASNAPSNAWVGIVRLYKGNMFLNDIVPSSSWNHPNGSIQYAVPSNSVTGDDFRIQVVLNSGPVGSESNIAEAWSTPFSIKSPTTSTNQSPQILYPLGGETLQSDTTNTISWNPVNYSGLFDVHLIGINSGNIYVIAQNIPVQATDKQSIQWTPRVGMYEKDAEFMAQVCRTGTNYCSKSNGFSINFPRIISSNSSFYYGLSKNNTNPPADQFTLTNISSTPVNFKISVPNKPSWLNCSYNTETMTMAGGSVMGVCVAIDVTKVSNTGTFSTTINLNGNFVGSPISIPVTLEVY